MTMPLLLLMSCSSPRIRCTQLIIRIGQDILESGFDALFFGSSYFRFIQITGLQEKLSNRYL